MMPSKGTVVVLGCLLTAMVVGGKTEEAGTEMINEQPGQRPDVLVELRLDSDRPARDTTELKYTALIENKLLSGHRMYTYERVGNRYVRPQTSTTASA